MNPLPDPDPAPDLPADRGSTGQSRRTCAAFVHLALLGAWAAASAAPITISTPFMNLENRAVNSLGFTPGQQVRFGAVSVVPNGFAGTTGVAIQDGSGITRSLNFESAPVTPNWFARYLTDDPALRGSWTLRFSNGTDVATAVVSLSAAAQQAPFVNSITLSGSSANPTFNWTPPPGVTVNGYRVNIFDKSLRSPTSSGVVVSRDQAPSVTSYTVQSSHFSVPGYAFELGRNYSIEISLIQTKDGTTNTSNSNLQAIARVYADFTPNDGGGPPVNLPVVLANGSYQFNMDVVPGVTYYIDPEVAVGYDYEIGAGNPNFATLDLPDNIGDGIYDIYGFDSVGALFLLADDWSGTRLFDFGPGGVGKFRVMGIETSAGLDPANTTAFITGLTFTGAGRFTGTQTPITATVAAVPEPSTLSLLALSLATVFGVRRRRDRIA